ncbi:hypothetical protein P8452_38639 [Trifolium repens]|nr:hypothetical protein P8452_38639 [Trifolium repens]
MNVNRMPHRWFHRLGLKLFAVNSRLNNLPNLWCLCSLSLNPTLLAVDDQHISLSVVIDGKTFGLSAVYASTCYIHRRNLWNALSQVQSQHLLPWCYMGDFNTILGCHEYRGNSTPARLPMVEFQNWTDLNNLIHLPTHGAFYTWANGRRGRHYTQKRLDRVICNQDWFNCFNSINVSTLTKNNSDHFPILFDFKILDCHQPSNFKFLKMWTSHPDCVNVVQQSWKVNVVGCPMFVLSEKLKILKVKLKSWNKVVFGNIHENVKQARNNVDSIQALIDSNGPSESFLEQEKLAQINLENALFMEELFWHEKSKDPDIDNGLVDEVIPNLITDRVNSPDGFGAVFFQTYWDIIQLDVINAVIQFFTSGWILPNFNSNTLVLIPKNENADSVNDYRPIAIANFKFKLISKIIADRLASIMPAITSIQQRGFIKGRNIKDCICLTSEAINVLHKRSFGGNLAIKVDIAKAFDTLQWPFLLRVLKAFGFNQILSLDSLYSHGDPLSLLLFCLAEEVISRSITKLVRDGKLSLIKGSKHMDVPSHILYADDIMLFCKASRPNIQSLSSLFIKYAETSGQFVNPSKSFIYAGAISSQRLHSIPNQLGFSIGVLPFVYLGIPIFKGKPKKCHLQPLADKIKSKLSAWKASFLSMAGRMQLIKSVIHGMLMHSISVYSWPSSLIKDIERWVRNFLWSGDVNQRKLVTVAWHKVCSPFDEGGLGIRSLSKINEAANLKLCWELTQSDLQWAKFLRFRVLKGAKPISYHIFSSVWSSIKHKFHEVCTNSSWQIGNGESINFWSDPWCGDPLVVTLNIPLHLHSSLQAKVKDFIENKSWKIPVCLLFAYPDLQSFLNNVTIPLCEREDRLLWKHSHYGDLSMKDSYSFHCLSGQLMNWTKIVWNVSIPPSKSMVVWRCLQHKLPTDDSLSFRGCSLPSMNQLRFNNKKIHWKSLINCIIASVSMSCNNSNLKAYSNISEFVLLQKFQVKRNFGNAPKIKEVLWQPPILNWIKCNCDGASVGNPGISACGGIFRNANASFLGVFALNIGINTSLNAELAAAMLSIEIASSKGWSHLWLESDSMLVVQAFSFAKIVPWALRNRWDNCLLKISNMNFYVSHIYREGNHCADKMANLGLSLPVFSWWNQVPSVLLDDFGKNRFGMPYYRFC